MIDSDIMKYKRKIANMICQNTNIIEALEVEPNDQLMYNYIYPYIYIPTVEQEVRTLIGFSLNCPKILKNEYFKDSELVIFVISHRNAMETEYGGTRTDVIESLLVDMLNWDVSIGMELRLKSSIEKIISDHYYARVIVFETLSLNSLENGVKNGSRRT